MFVLYLSELPFNHIFDDQDFQITLYLGVQFDSEISMSAHVNLTCRNLFVQIRSINSVRKSMSEKVTASIIHSYTFFPV